MKTFYKLMIKETFERTIEGFDSGDSLDDAVANLRRRTSQSEKEPELVSTNISSKIVNDDQNS